MDEDRARPTVISLEWDYGYDSVLLDRSPGVLGVATEDPIELGLSEGLVRRLRQWLDRQDALSARWVRDEPDTEESLHAEAVLRRELLALAYDVQHELGRAVDVLLDGRPLREHRS